MLRGQSPDARDAFVRDAGDDAPVPDSGTDAADIARCFVEPGGASSLTLDAFETEFATPNTIRVRWESTDPIDQFSGYEVLLMEAGLAECDVTRFDSTTNVGLGFFRSPSPGHQLNAVSLNQMMPATDYMAQLIVRDESGGQLASPLLSVRTADAPTGEIVLFSEEATAGYSIPGEFTYATGAAYSGSGYYEYVSTCEGGCFENLRRQDIDVSMASLSEDDFEQAYYEFAVSSSAAEHSYYSQARLMFEQADGSNALFVYEPFVIVAGGEYALHQVPLRVFEQFDAGRTRLSYEAASRSAFEFTVGGTWPLGETVRIDEVRIRW